MAPDSPRTGIPNATFEGSFPPVHVTQSQTCHTPPSLFLLVEVMMCWSLTASATMVAAGSAAAIYTVHKRLPPVVPATLGYFTVMEALQTGGHLVVGACGTPANQLITLLSYLHIVFQPFFINAFAMQLLPEGVRRRIRSSVYGLCAVSSAFMLAQLVPWDWAGACRIGQPLCGPELCVRQGSWHIVWDIPYNGLTTKIDDLIALRIGFPTYMLTVFAMPIVYGAWRFTVFHVLAGPVLASLVTSGINEVPTVWCLFSIAIIVVALVPGLMRQLESNRWYLWPKGWILPAPR